MIVAKAAETCSLTYMYDKAAYFTCAHLLVYDMSLNIP